MKKLLIALFATSAFLGGAHAADVQEDVAQEYLYYLSVQGIYGPALNDYDVSVFGFPFDLTANTDNGFAVGATGGMFLDENWRVGLELNYGNIDIESLSFPGVIPLLTPGADVDSLFGFLDVGYEFALTDNVGAFVEAGIGFIHSTLNGGPVLAGLLADDSDTALAGKLGAGLTYSLNEQFDLYGKYNFIFADDIDFTGLGGVPISAEAMTHTLFVGLRYKF